MDSSPDANADRILFPIGPIWLATFIYRHQGSHLGANLQWRGSGVDLQRRHVYGSPRAGDIGNRPTFSRRQFAFPCRLQPQFRPFRRLSSQQFWTKENRRHAALDRHHPGGSFRFYPRRLRVPERRTEVILHMLRIARLVATHFRATRLVVRPRRRPPTHVHLATINVMSSACSWGLNARACPATAARNSGGGSSRRCRAAATRRSSPNSSPSPFTASVTPSV